MCEKIFKKNWEKPGFFIALPDFLREARGIRQNTFSVLSGNFLSKKPDDFFLKKYGNFFSGNNRAVPLTRRAYPQTPPPSESPCTDDNPDPQQALITKRAIN